MSANLHPSPHLICLGEVLIDLFPAELGRRLADVSAFIPKPGGAPANAAVAAAKLGVPSAFIGKVGNDAFGHHLVEVLRAENVDVSGMRMDKYARTTLAFIAKPDENTAEFIFYRNPGADLMLSKEDLDEGMLCSARALHFGSLSLVSDPVLSATKHAVEIVRSSGGLVSFDVNYRPNLWDSAEKAMARIREMVPAVHLLKLNEEELHLLTGLSVGEDGRAKDACLRLLDEGPRLVVVTLGDKGAYFCTRTCDAFVAAFRVKAVDAVGCGDGFIASLLTRLIAENDWQSHLNLDRLREDFRFANAVGAITVTRRGGIPSLPYRDEVDAFLARH